MRIEIENIEDITKTIAMHCEHLGYMELILAVCDGDIIFGDTSCLPVKQYLRQLEDKPFHPRYYLLIFKNDNGSIYHLGYSNKKAIDEFLFSELNMTTNKFMIEHGTDVLLGCIN